jgi:hypothetical protein
MDTVAHGAFGAVDWSAQGPDYLNAFSPTSRIRRWAVALVWESSGRPASIFWRALSRIAGSSVLDRTKTVLLLRRKEQRNMN